MENYLLKTQIQWSRSLLALVLALFLGGIRDLSAADPEPHSASPGSNYLLTGSDVILVKVFQEPDLDSQHRISKDGTIVMPLIGVVNVGGKNVGDAANLIRGMLARGYLRNPQVRVNILQYAPRRYSVLGQVQRPGNYNMGEETVTTLLEAVAMAGGFSKSADLGSVIVRRKVNGQEKVFEVNAKNMGKGQAKDAFQIIAGDTIIVGERLF